MARKKGIKREDVKNGVNNGYGDKARKKRRQGEMIGNINIRGRI